MEEETSFMNIDRYPRMHARVWYVLVPTNYEVIRAMT
jgi:hypothetical protein